MGSRLGVIVKTSGGLETYYHQWAAQTLGLDIVLAGPELTIRRVRSMDRISDVATAEEWPGMPLVEGSLLIDLIDRTVVWAEESEALYLPRLINYLIEHSWPGWTAIWSAEGIPGTLRAAGIDPQPTLYRLEGQKEVEILNDQDDLYPWTINHGNDPITVRLDTGEMITWRAIALLDQITQLTPERFHLLAVQIKDRAPAETSIWQSRVCASAPETGIYVDYPQQQVQWWSLYEEELPVFSLTPDWNRWTFESHGDDYSWHEELIGTTLRTWQQNVNQLRDHLPDSLAELPPARFINRHGVVHPPLA